MFAGAPPPPPPHAAKNKAKLIANKALNLLRIFWIAKSNKIVTIYSLQDLSRIFTLSSSQPIRRHRRRQLAVAPGLESNQ